MRIIFQTVVKVFKRADISEDGMETAEDFGDYLLRIGSVSKDEYENLQSEAKELIKA